MKRIRAWLLYTSGGIIIVLMLWDLLLSDHGYFVYKQEHQQLEALESEIRDLQQQQHEVKSRIIRLREDPGALEEVIHRELGYVYPDEFMLIMPEKTENEQIPQRSGHE